MAIHPDIYTPEEYLALDRADEYKNEYLDGQIYPMDIVNQAHNLITGNILFRLMECFENRPYRVYASRMRVGITATSSYTYPDVVAICNPGEFADDEHEILINPILIVEVFSQNTEKFDRCEKFDHYRQIPSLIDYVLVDQDEMRLEHFTRRSAGWFVLPALKAPEDMFNIPSVDCTIGLAAVYENVNFPSPFTSRGHTGRFIKRTPSRGRP